jgi:hypothetical protein
MEEIKDTVIYWPAVRIIAHPPKEELKEVLVDIEILKWKNHEGYPYITLLEISKQLKKLGYQSPYYVWAEMGLSGEIYMYGNYNPPEWVEHGKTRGYA